MQEFFHGWRRKSGVVSLMMACVFLAGWLRSRSLQEELTVEIGGGSTLRVVSVNQCVLFVNTAAATTNGRIRTKWWHSRPGVELVWQLQNQDVAALAGIRPFRLDRLAFQIQSGTYSATWFTLPYWSITVPMTVLSACFLLWPVKRPEKPQTLA